MTKKLLAPYLLFIITCMSINLNCFNSFGRFQDNNHPSLIDTIKLYSDDYQKSNDTIKEPIDSTVFIDTTNQSDTAIQYFVMNDTATLRINRPDTASYNQTKAGIDYTNENARNIKPLKFPKLRADEGVIKAFLIAFIILIVLYLISKMIVGASSNKKVNKTLNEEVNLLDDAAQNLDKTDLEQLLTNALAKNDYKSAIRIYYLMVLKTMWDRKLLHWRKDKTNGDYLAELYGGNWFESFKKATLHFERTWYGNIFLTEEIYTEIQSQFISILNSLKGGNNES